MCFEGAWIMRQKFASIRFSHLDITASYQSLRGYKNGKYHSQLKHGLPLTFFGVLKAI